VKWFDVDVMVVGAGPAGLATALALRKQGGLSVALLDRGAPGAGVGETLAPGARDLLKALGLLADFEAQGHLPAYGTAAAWGQPELATRDFLMTPFGCGWTLDRARFDGLLGSHAEALGDLRVQAGLGRVERLADGWRVISNDPSACEFKARFLVDASGRASGLARRLGARLHFLDRQVAVLGEFALPPGAALDQLTVVEACAQGWAYSVRIPGDRLIVALLSDGDCARASGLFDLAGWNAVLDMLPHTRLRLRDATACAALRPVAAHSARLDRFTGEDWLAVGDAAASHDPLSGSGIQRALAGGLRAAQAIHRHLVSGESEALEAYASSLADDFGRYMQTHAQYYALEQRWPTQPFWRRRQPRVELHPQQILMSQGRRRLPALPAPLLGIDPAALLASATQPRPAHQLLAEHGADPGRTLQVLLGLQWLLDVGALRLQPASMQTST
jgi:flavin-dependent dehydrogenase